MSSGFDTTSTGLMIFCNRKLFFINREAKEIIQNETEHKIEGTEIGELGKAFANFKTTTTSSIFEEICDYINSTTNFAPKIMYPSVDKHFYKLTMCNYAIDTNWNTMVTITDITNIQEIGTQPISTMKYGLTAPLKNILSRMKKNLKNSEALFNEEYMEIFKKINLFSYSLSSFIDLEDIIHGRFSLETKPTKITKLAEKLARLYNEKANIKIEIEQGFPETILLGRKRLLQTIISTLDVFLQNDNKAEVLITIKANSKQLCIEFIDKLSKICFDNQNEYQHSDIGIHIASAYAIVNAMKGKINVNYEEGTKVCIEIPFREKRSCEPFNVFWRFNAILQKEE